MGTNSSEKALTVYSGVSTMPLLLSLVPNHEPVEADRISKLNCSISANGSEQGPSGTCAQRKSSSTAKGKEDGLEFARRYQISLSRTQWQQGLIFLAALNCPDTESNRTCL